MDDSSVQPTPLVQNVFRLLKMRDDEGLQTDISLKKWSKESFHRIFKYTFIHRWCFSDFIFYSNSNRIIK